MAEINANKFLSQNADIDSSEVLHYNKTHRPGLTMMEVANQYSVWGKTSYENDLNGRYNGPKYVADTLAETFPENRNQLRVLDIAAGTGLLGEKLSKLGFEKIDALDPSEGMLDIAKERNIYSILYCEYIADKILPIESDFYDCLVLSGGMGEGHIPCSALDEMVRLTKPGGYLVIAMRKEYLETVKEYKGKLEARMKELEDSGKWKMVQRKVVPKYSFNNDGILFKFCVC